MPKSSLKKTHKKRVKSLINIKILSILGFIILMIFAVLYWQFHKAPITDDKNIAARQQEVDIIYPRQKQIIDFYQSLQLDKQTKIYIFYELMGPLGGLDAISSPSGIVDIHATINYLYGFNFRAFGFPTEESGYSVTAPVRNELDFPEKEYFAKTKNELSSLAKSFENDKELDVLSLGYSTNYRINNYFGDDMRNFYWKINKDPGDPFYKYEILSKNNEEVNGLRNKYNSLFRIMDKLKIQTVYKCGDKIIFIVDGVADNAFGYIYNAKNSNDVNCGLLDRFRIQKDIPVDENWRFWFAK